MSDFQLNGFVKSLFDGYKAATKDDHTNKFEELVYTPFLFSSQYLNEMYNLASTKEDHETILDHLYRHKATEVYSYKRIENKIIDLYYTPEISEPPKRAKLYSIKGGRRK